MVVARRRLLGAVLSVTLAGLAAAQSSNSYVLETWSINSGGVVPASEPVVGKPYRLSLAAIGDPVYPVPLSGASFTLDAGSVEPWRPAGEVPGLRLDDAALLDWDTAPGARLYNLYRGDLIGLSSPSAGSCLQSDIPVTSAADNASPPSAGGFFYLVTATDRFGKEGTWGSGNSAGTPTQRTGLACP